MKPFYLLLCVPLAVVACSKDEPGAADDLPVAQNWSGESPAAAPQAGMGGDPHAGMDMGGDPHAGMDMGGDPHAGMDMGADPHAGMDMGGDPHAGMGGDPASANMLPPDPNRPIDPNKHVKGRIEASPELAKLIKPGAIIFLSVRPIDKATGETLGQPLAVDRIDVKTLPVPFELTEANSMVRGTQFSGDVQVYARVDGDAEASSVQPGDIEGSVTATIPAAGLRLVLDQVRK